ncbi:hypothetical protein K6U06_07770 [Acidiferrimicrobium sp. IK]|uniref:hypothetical protein n=1 Tax=Acidiferrimicrobium sp. IK TaxID=2871700 RepID=UPI0021CAEBAA|nr:hypothetical protein [Acidiferrimicrobium sp. IK]MCU4184255.1 hypothetical protein [Acidiferrimicrobium sp. IK]
MRSIPRRTPSRSCRVGLAASALLAAAGVAVPVAQTGAGLAAAPTTATRPAAPAVHLTNSEVPPVGARRPGPAHAAEANVWGHVAVAAAPTPDGRGFWVVWADGSVSALGTAKWYGDMAGHALNAPMVGISASPDGAGYWLLGRDGGVFNFGDAPFDGSTGNIHLNAPALQMTTPGIQPGYYFAAGDGGVFTFGGAPFYGSTGNIRLNKPVVGMASTSSGSGYWLVASDGGIFPFGQAGFYGSTGNVRLNQPVVGMAPTSTGHGYWLVAADGGVFTFGDAAFHGSAVGMTNGAQVVGLVAANDGGGYWVILSNGGVLSFGNAPQIAGAPGAPAPSAATSSHYTFEVTNSSGQPARWNSCEAVPFAVVTPGAPANWLADVTDAVSQVSAATGLSFVDEGAYSSLSAVPSSAKVTISWAPSLSGSDAVGLTTYYYILDSRFAPQITGAKVQILSSLSSGLGMSGEIPVLLHELGHAVGLGHFAGADVMNPVDQGYSSYQPGDLAGLSRVGAAQGCSGFYS